VIERDAATRGPARRVVEAGTRVADVETVLAPSTGAALPAEATCARLRGPGERRHLMTTAKHIVSARSSSFPGYAGRRPWLFTRGGIAIYKASSVAPPASFAPLDAHESTPHSRRPAQREPPRRAVLTSCQTRRRAPRPRNAARRRGRRCGVVAKRRDVSSGTSAGASRRPISDEKERAIRAQDERLVQKTGPFSDASSAGRRGATLRPTLGVHVVLSAEPAAARLGASSCCDRRATTGLFSSSRRVDGTVVGTTATDVPAGRAGSPPASATGSARGRADVEYLPRPSTTPSAGAQSGPEQQGSARDDGGVAHAPLLARGAGATNTPSQTSRETSHSLSPTASSR